MEPLTLWVMCEIGEIVICEGCTCECMVRMGGILIMSELYVYVFSIYSVRPSLVLPPSLPPSSPSLPPVPQLSLPPRPQSPWRRGVLSPHSLHGLYRTLRCREGGLVPSGCSCLASWEYHLWREHSRQEGWVCGGVWGCVCVWGCRIFTLLLPWLQVVVLCVAVLWLLWRAWRGCWDWRRPNCNVPLTSRVMNNHQRWRCGNHHQVRGNPLLVLTTCTLFSCFPVSHWNRTRPAMHGMPWPRRCTLVCLRISWNGSTSAFPSRALRTTSVYWTLPGSVSFISLSTHTSLLSLINTSSISPLSLSLSPLLMSLSSFPPPLSPSHLHCRVFPD